jgi:hypothetical protein
MHSHTQSRAFSNLVNEKYSFSPLPKQPKEAPVEKPSPKKAEKKPVEDPLEEENGAKAAPAKKGRGRPAASPSAKAAAAKRPASDGPKKGKLNLIILFLEGKLLAVIFEIITLIFKIINS